MLECQIYSVFQRKVTAELIPKLLKALAQQLSTLRKTYVLYLLLGEEGSLKVSDPESPAKAMILLLTQQL